MKKKCNFFRTSSVPGANFSLSNVSFLNSIPVGVNGGSTPRSLTVSDDGAKLFLVNYLADNIVEYSFGINFDITTLTYSQSFSVNPKQSQPRGSCFGNSGNKMYIVGTQGGRVSEYDLSTPWDISTAVWVQNFTIVEDLTTLNAYFSSDGTVMFVVGGSTSTIYQYDLSTPWDISTAVYNLSKKDITPDATGVVGIYVSPDGLNLFISSEVAKKVIRYVMSSANDVSTAVYSEEYAATAQDTVTFDCFFTSDGNRMYLLGQNTDTIYQYSLI